MWWNQAQIGIEAPLGFQNGSQTKRNPKWISSLTNKPSNLHHLALSENLTSLTCYSDCWNHSWRTAHSRDTHRRCAHTGVRGWGVLAPSASVTSRWSQARHFQGLNSIECAKKGEADNVLLQLQLQGSPLTVSQLQWQRKEMIAYSYNFFKFLIDLSYSKNVWIQWHRKKLPSYSDTFSVSQHCRCKQGDLYRHWPEVFQAKPKLWETITVMAWPIVVNSNLSSVFPSAGLRRPKIEKKFIFPPPLEIHFVHHIKFLGLGPKPILTLLCSPW